jgi:hypothetical protein
MHRKILALLVAAVLVAGCKKSEKQECGDNKIQDPEVCDGTGLGGETCQTLGFLGGTLGCLPNCEDYFLNNCRGGCGNNEAEGTAEGLATEEACDGTDLRGQNCTIEGFELGSVACLPDCTGFDTSSCYNPTCGDGTIEGSEECEPEVTITDDCIDLGYNEGELACSSCQYDESACVTWECGNGVLEGTGSASEQCDGTVFRDDMDCAGLGFDDGEIACFAPESDTPCMWDDSGCFDYVCGNGEVEGSEDCEPGVAFTEVCTGLGFLSGDLACTAAGGEDECLWDLSGCVGGCGNDIIEGTADGLSADEVCDGTALADEDCVSLGHTGGDLACLPDCTDYDETGCVD